MITVLHYSATFLSSFPHTIRFEIGPTLAYYMIYSRGEFNKIAGRELCPLKVLVGGEFVLRNLFNINCNVIKYCIL